MSFEMATNQAQSFSTHHTPSAARSRRDRLQRFGALFASAGVVASLIQACTDRSQNAPESSSQTQPAIPQESIEASLSAINQYMQSAEWVKAEAIARTLVERAPNDARAHEMLGQLLIERSIQAEPSGDSASARDLRRQAWEAYRRAVELDSENAGLHHSAGLVAMEAGESDAALAMFLKAEAIDSTKAQYPLFAAQLLMKAGRLEEAEAALERARAVSPEEPYVLASLAMVALEQGRADQAVQFIQQARRAEPENVQFRAQHAKILRRDNRHREALELLIGLPPHERSQEAVAFELAASFEAMGRFGQAADAWAACCQADPGRPGALRAAVNASGLYLKAGDRENAERWAQIARTLNASAPEVRELLERLSSSAP